MQNHAIRDPAFHTFGVVRWNFNKEHVNGIINTFHSENLRSHWLSLHNSNTFSCTHPGSVRMHIHRDYMYMKTSVIKATHTWTFSTPIMHYGAWYTNYAYPDSEEAAWPVSRCPVVQNLQPWPWPWWEHSPEEWREAGEEKAITSCHYTQACSVCTGTYHFSTNYSYFPCMLVILKIVWNIRCRPDLTCTWNLQNNS